MTQLAGAESAARPDSGLRLRTVAFVLTLMVSASLLFVVQPMFAKLALPLFGGTPAVWNTAMLFFQAALLAGYAYAHWIASHLSLGRQVLLHGLLLAGALLTLPIGLPQGWVPDPGVFPGFTLIGVMTLAIGVPFVLVSSTAPLLQSWFARASGERREDPYFLYAASNFGSLVALLAYPFAIEPTLELGQQTAFWSIGFVVLLALVVGCGLVTLRAGGNERAVSSAAPFSYAAPITMGQRMHWIALAFVPSSLLLGTTTYITTDIAAVPLLWVLPLTLYLLTFVIAFSARPFPRHVWVVRATPYVIAAFIVATGVAPSNTMMLVGVNLVMMFTLALMCHGELARYRPPASQLTEFYLLVSFGGVLGGLFNALIAPLAFNNVYEYPLAIALGCMLLPAYGRQSRLVWAVVLAALLLAGGMAIQIYGDEFPKLPVFGTAVLAVIAFGAFRQPLHYGLAVGAILAAPFIWRAIDTMQLETTRSFFGVHSVRRDTTGEFNIMRHGTTLHGAQFLDPARQREPLTYYGVMGPVGQVFSAIDPTRLREVGAVGLGTGSVSCYRQEGQNWTFFEIDHTVIETAKNGPHFTYVRNCAPDARMVLGDARLSLAAEPNARYDMLILDAFSSDAIPVHLLTREALALYLDKLKPDGILLIHVSNRYLDLAPLVGNLGAERGKSVLQKDFNPTAAQSNDWISGATWMMITDNTVVRSWLERVHDWQHVQADPAYPVWTDSYSNLVGVLK